MKSNKNYSLSQQLKLFRVTNATHNHNSWSLVSQSTPRTVLTCRCAETISKMSLHIESSSTPVCWGEQHCRASSGWTSWYSRPQLAQHHHLQQYCSHNHLAGIGVYHKWWGVFRKDQDGAQHRLWFRWLFQCWSSMKTSCSSSRALALFRATHLY